MEEQKTNPFLRALGQAATTVAAMPVRAVKLPFQLLGEALNLDAGADAAQRQQQQLAEQVTGQPVPYSEGRAYANALSLGLIPGNKPMNVDPSTLNPEQQQRFQQLNPLQQALLQAKNPRDFAELLQRDEFFAERPTPTPYTDSGKVNADLSQGLISPAQAALEENLRVQDSLGRAVNPVNPESYTAESLAEYERTRDFSVLKRDTTKADQSQANALELEDVRQRHRMALEEERAAHAQERAQRTADAKAAAGAEPKPEDPYKVANREGALRDDFRQNTRDLQKAAIGFRQARALFGLKDPSRIDAATRKEIEKTVPVILDPSNRAARDMAESYVFFKTIDPGGRITDTETGLIRGLNQVLGGFLGAEKAAEIVGNLNRREALTDQLRAEMHLAMAKAFEAQFQNYDDQVRNTLKTALRMRLGDPANNLPGIPLQPLNSVEDTMADMRELFLKQAGVSEKQARYVLADDEAEQLLSALFRKEHNGRAPESASEWVDFANSMGFRLNVAE